MNFSLEFSQRKIHGQKSMPIYPFVWKLDDINPLFFAKRQLATLFTFFIREFLYAEIWWKYYSPPAKRSIHERHMILVIQ